jgi:hypothetical protein
LEVLVARGFVVVTPDERAGGEEQRDHEQDGQRE